MSASFDEINVPSLAETLTSLAPTACPCPESMYAIAYGFAARYPDTPPEPCAYTTDPDAAGAVYSQSGHLRAPVVDPTASAAVVEHVPGPPDPVPSFHAYAHPAPAVLRYNAVSVVDDDPFSRATTLIGCPAGGENPGFNARMSAWSHVVMSR